MINFRHIRARLHRKKPSKGLTFIEVMASLGIMFLASSFCMGMFVQGSRVPDRAEKNLLLAEQAQFALDKELAKCDSSLAGQKPPAAYQAPTPILPTDSQTYMVTAPSGDQYDVVMTHTPATALNPPLPGFTVIAVDVKDKFGRSVHMQSLRRINAIPAWPVVPAPFVLTPAEQAIATSEIQNTCFGCHAIGVPNPTNPLGVPPWFRDSILATAKKNNLTVEQYVRQRMEGNTSLINVAGYTSVMSKQYDATVSGDPAKLDAVAKALTNAVMSDSLSGL